MGPSSGTDIKSKEALSGRSFIMAASYAFFMSKYKIYDVGFKGSKVSSINGLFATACLRHMQQIGLPPQILLSTVQCISLSCIHS